MSLLVALGGCAGGEPARPVDRMVADPALAACVAAVAGVADASVTVPEADLAAIDQLHCDGRDAATGPIRSLAGIEHLPALSNLDLPRNAISDLGPLAGHDALRTLDLSSNAVADVGPLAGLPALDTLRLSRNAIVDPTPLGSIPTLLVLDVFGNRIADVGGLADAPLLEELQLGANPVTDLTPLLGVTTLTNLGLDETDGTRLTGVEQLRAAGVSVNGLA